MSDEAVAGKPVAASWRCGCWLWMRLISGHREVCLCGLDRCVCRWAAARPRDRHTRAFGSESSISKPGQALRTLRHPPHRWGFSLLCTSHPGPADPGHCGQAPQPGLSCPAAHASPSTPAVPGVLVGDRRRFEARPGPAPAHRHRSWAPAGGCMPCVGFQSGPLGGAALGAGWRRVAGVSRL